MPVDIRTMAGHFNGADLTITGASLSADQALHPLSQAIPTIATAAGTTEVLFTASAPGTISEVSVVFKEALAASDTNFVTFALRSYGQAGAGNVAVLATTPAGTNTTKVTGGTALAALTARILVLNPANVAVAKNDVLGLQVIGSGTLANTLTQGRGQIRLSVAT